MEFIQNYWSLVQSRKSHLCRRVFVFVSTCFALLLLLHKSGETLHGIYLKLKYSGRMRGKRTPLIQVSVTGDITRETDQSHISEIWIWQVHAWTEQLINMFYIVFVLSVIRGPNIEFFSQHILGLYALHLFLFVFLGIRELWRHYLFCSS